MPMYGTTTIQTVGGSETYVTSYKGRRFYRLHHRHVEWSEDDKANEGNWKEVSPVLELCLESLYVNQEMLCQIIDDEADAESRADGH